MLAKLIGKEEDEGWIEALWRHVPYPVYGWGQDFVRAVRSRAYWKRLRSALLDRREIDYDRMSWNYNYYLYENTYEVCKLLLGSFINWGYHEAEGDLYNLMGLSEILMWEPGSEHMGKFLDKDISIEEYREIQNKEFEYQEECKKEFFSLLHKRINILWR